MWLGLEPGHLGALRGCERLWQWQARWRVPETCIASMQVRLTSHFRHDANRPDEVVADLLEQRLTEAAGTVPPEPTRTEQ